MNRFPSLLIANLHYILITFKTYDGAQFLLKIFYFLTRQNWNYYFHSVVDALTFLSNRTLTFFRLRLRKIGNPSLDLVDIYYFNRIEIS